MSRDNWKKISSRSGVSCLTFRSKCCSPAKLDVGAHPLVQPIENIRTEDLVDDVHARLDIVADTARCHVPRAISRLRRATLDCSIAKYMPRQRSVDSGQSVIEYFCPNTADTYIRPGNKDLLCLLVLNRHRRIPPADMRGDPACMNWNCDVASASPRLRGEAKDCAPRSSGAREPISSPRT